MPRTVLAVQTAPTAYADDGLALTFTASDVANGNRFLSDGKEIVIVKNTDAAPRSFTFVSAPNDLGRDENRVDSFAVNEARLYRMTARGWRQADGYVNIDGEHVGLVIAIVRMAE